MILCLFSLDEVEDKLGDFWPWDIDAIGWALIRAGQSVEFESHCSRLSPCLECALQGHKTTGLFFFGGQED